jgi:hypothetical protein
VKALVVLLLPAVAMADPTCWPQEIGGDAVAVSVGVSLQQHASAMWWECKDGSVNYLVGDGTLTLSALGGRMDTVLKAADMQKAALASWRRNVDLPMTDPRFSVALQAARADHALFKRDPDAWAK